ncbi:phenylacetate--CoA ligase family protein [Streptomyces sp. NPDC055400]
MAASTAVPGFVPADRAARTDAALRSQLAYTVARSPFYERLWRAAGVSPGRIRTVAELAELPFTEKQQLRDSQVAAPPLGTHAAAPMAEIIRLHASTGTTGRPSWVGVTRSDADAWTDAVATALSTQGLTSDDIVIHGSGLTLFVGGLPVRDAAERIGATLVPIGTGASEKALLALDSMPVTALHSTPSYARYLADYLRERGRDPREFGLRKIIVGGEPGGGEPAFRERVRADWGATVTEGLGNADMAPIIFAEPPGAAGMRLTAQDIVLVELIDPVSGDVIPAEPGASGELVYTSLGRRACPLIRLRTRDRVTVTGRDADGAPLIRCVGRTDDMLIVLGVNVFPSAVRDVVQTLHPRTTGTLRVLLESRGPRVEPPLRVEVEAAVAEGSDADVTLGADLEGLIRSRLSIPATVRVVPAGTLERSEMKTRLVHVVDGRA